MGSSSGSSGPDCRDCGTTLDPETNYCPNCGAAAPDGGLADYCRTCGEEFADDDRFCASCGAVRNPSVSGEKPPSGRHESGGAESQQEFRQQIQMYLADGWEIERDYGDSVVLVDRGYGNIGIHLVLFFVTGGLGNIPYVWYHYSPNASAERLRLTADGSHPGRAPEHEREDSDSSTAAVVGGALLIMVGLLGIAAGAADPDNWIIGAALVAIGLYVFPPAKRRFDRRHPVTEFGTVQTTEETVVESPDKPCVVCGRPIDEGIRRDYREEKAVAGIPLYTTHRGENHYCVDCAATDGGAGQPSVSASREPELEFDVE